MSGKYRSKISHEFVHRFSGCSDRTSYREGSRVVVICRKEIETDERKQEDGSREEYDNGDKYGESAEKSVLKEFRQNLFVSFCCSVNDAGSEWCLCLYDRSLSFSFEHEQFFFFIGCIFDRVWIVYVCLFFTDNEKIKGAVDSQCENESKCEYSKYSDWNIGEKFSYDTGKCHHWDKNHNRRDYSGYDRNGIFLDGKGECRTRIISNAKFCISSLDDYDDRVDRNTE